MNWEYLAGFTDGEGWIGVSGGRAPKVTWGQNDKPVMDALVAFLRQEGFHPTRNVIKAKLPRRPNPIQMVHLCRKREVARFIRIIRPRVIVKAVACDKLLAWIAAHPMQLHNDPIDPEFITQSVKDGFTIHWMAEHVGCGYVKMEKAVAALGLRANHGLVLEQRGSTILRRAPTRTKEEAKQHRRIHDKVARCQDCGKRASPGARRCNACAVSFRNRTRAERNKSLGLPYMTFAPSAETPSVAPGRH